MAEEIRKNQSFIGLLAANAILGSAMPMLILLGSLAGLSLAPHVGLATFPPSIQTLAGLIAAIPFSLFMGRYGRKFGFGLGGSIAIMGGLLGAVSLHLGSFTLLCLAHFLLGAAMTSYQYFRFAAVEVVSKNWQPVAISLMLSSGIIAALLGPEIFNQTKNYVSTIPLAGAYLALSALSMIGLLPLLFVKESTQLQVEQKDKYSFSQSWNIVKKPAIYNAICVGAISYGIMIFMMIATPIAMIKAELSEDLASDVIRWHVIAMFVPSFFTGFIMKKYGVKPIVITGLFILLGSMLIAMTGMSTTHFYISLVLLGIGWNFGFIGATAMLTRSTIPDEQSIAQGINDMVIALFSTLFAFAAGSIVTQYGWTILATISLPITLIGLLSVILWRAPQENNLKYK